MTINKNHDEASGDMTDVNFVGDDVIYDDGVSICGARTLAWYCRVPFSFVMGLYDRGIRGGDLLQACRERFGSGVGRGDRRRTKDDGLIVNGVIYSTVSDACRKLGVRRSAYEAAIANGLTPQQALGVEPVVGVGGAIEVDGVVFNGWNELAKHYGVLPMVVRRRFSAGMRGIDLVRPKAGQVRVFEPVLRFIAGGIGYRSAAHACREIGVHYQTYMQRIARGLSVNQALGLDFYSRMQSIEVDGVVFNGWKELAKHYGVSYDMVRRRYLQGKRGMDLVAVWQPKSRAVVEPALKFWVAGVGYKSAVAACKALGVNFVTYSHRIRRGLTVEQALGVHAVEDGRSKNARKYDLDGSLLTVRELSEKFNLPRSSIERRLDCGATVRQAVGLDAIEVQAARLINPDIKKSRKRTKPFSVVVNGVNYDSYTSLAKAHGLPYHVVYGRIRVGGYTPLEAVTINGKGTPVFVRDVSYESMAAAARAHGITPELARSRMAHGSSLEQALGLEVKPNGQNIVFRGVVYRTKKSLCQHFSISTTALDWRVRKGASIQDAVEELLATKQ